MTTVATSRLFLLMSVLIANWNVKACFTEAVVGNVSSCVVAVAAVVGFVFAREAVDPAVANDVSTGTTGTTGSERSRNVV